MSLVLAGGILLGLGCWPVRELPVPTADEASAFYTGAGIEATVSGNVVTITVPQPYEYLRRGGSLWAKSTPYLYVFSVPTRKMFDEYEGLAGVRVVSKLAGGEEVARALLRRDELNGITWEHALRASAVAIRDGTRRPQTLRDLVNYGEDRTEFRYNERYAPSRRGG